MNRRSIAPIVLTLSALLGSTGAAPTLAGTDRPVESDSACDPVEGLGALPAEPMLLFGELHGTDRGPAAFGAVACRVARQHGSVVVALEIDHTEQERLDAYLESPGRPEDRERLLAGAFWTDSYQDGRRSRAMADLLERFRRLGRDGIEVEVIAFDPLPTIDPAQREEHLARRLTTARKENPETPFLVLVGNLHARTAHGTPWNEDFLPMGARIADAGVEVLPIDVRHAGGSAWICTGSSASDCGSRSVRGSGSPRDVPSLELFPEPEPETGYAGALWVGEIEASPPAAPASPPAWQPEEGRALLGTPAPEWRGLEWLQGGPLSLDELRGKVVLLRFWLVGCPYCRRTAPALVDFHERYGDRGLVVVGIHHPKSDAARDPDVVRRAAERYGFDFPLALDDDWATIRAYGVGSHFRRFTSVSFLIGPEGRIRWVHDGGAYRPGDDEEGRAHDSLVAAIEQWLPDRD